MNVHAVDSSSVACHLLDVRRRECDSSNGTLRVECAPLEWWSLPDDTFDLIIDSYVSCHLLGEGQRSRYLNSLAGRLKPGGYLFTSSMGVNDGYYKQFLGIVPSQRAISTDPLNGIAKRLSDSSVADCPSEDEYEVVAAVAEEFEDQVDGRTWTRQVHAALIQRTA